jgi:hypothetical protein
VGGPKIERDPTLSVCCLTRGPTARVAAQLELLRDVAAEIVVGLDTSVPADLAGPLSKVADVLVHYPYADPVDRPVGWIHSLCTGDWILWVDDDEIPSAALVRTAREILRETSVTHCFVPRRTLWRDPQSVLLGPPWVPDFQLRLVQNDPRVVWFPGITHWPIQALGPHRYLEAPLYHTDLLLNPLERRREKVRRYETAVPGRRVAGLPMNDAYFLPEDRAEVRLTAVADEDRETIQRLLELEPWPEPEEQPASIRVASRVEIDAHWHGAPARDDLYRGTVELVDELEPFSVGEERGVVVRVASQSSHVWPHGGFGWPSVRVSYRWLDDEGRTAVADGLRTPLPETLAPGASLAFPIDVLAPPVAGAHTLVVDLLHEPVRWFGCEASAPVEIRAALRVAILADDEGDAARAAARLAEVAPAIVPLLLSAVPERSTELLGYEAAPDPRAYLLRADAPRRGVRGVGGAVARAGALVGDALLVRAGRRPHLAAPSGAAYLDGLHDADALLVVGDEMLRGTRGERETLQRGAALAAAAALGLDVLVVSKGSAPGGLTSRLAGLTAQTVQVGPAGLDEAVSEAIRLLLERAR